MEVKVSLSSGIIDWTHKAESSVQHQHLISGFCWSIKHQFLCLCLTTAHFKTITALDVLTYSSRLKLPSSVRRKVTFPVTFLTWNNFYNVTCSYRIMNVCLKCPGNPSKSQDISWKTIKDQAQRKSLIKFNPVGMMRTCIELHGI